MAKVIPMEFLRSSSHSIRFNGSAQVDKEEFFLEYKSEWRGADAYVQVRCSRYRHSSGLSDWRVTMHRVAAEDKGVWDAFTQTARSRLFEVAEPFAKEFIKLDAYRISEVNAIMYAIRNEIRDSYHISAPKRLVADPIIARKIGASCVGLVNAAIDARQRYEDALDRVQ